MVKTILTVRQKPDRALAHAKPTPEAGFKPPLVHLPSLPSPGFSDGSSSLPAPHSAWLTPAGRRNRARCWAAHGWEQGSLRHGQETGVVQVRHGTAYPLGPLLSQPAGTFGVLAGRLLTRMAGS